MQQSAESYTFEQAVQRLPETEAWVRTVLKRLDPLLPHGQLDVLEVGCSQGRGLVALTKAGHRAVGIEPYAPALTIAAELAASQGIVIDAREGEAESLPCESGQFDVVLAFSVLEHVRDLDRSLDEIFRVLKPGGVLWFNSASAMCPVQGEITHLPLFGWYPDGVKRRLMYWARDNRPAWVGHTQTPAIHWWTPRKARRVLGRAGFTGILDRWQLLDPGETSETRARVVRVIRRRATLRAVGDIFVADCSYAAVKPSSV